MHSRTSWQATVSYTLSFADSERRRCRSSTKVGAAGRRCIDRHQYCEGIENECCDAHSTSGQGRCYRKSLFALPMTNSPSRRRGDLTNVWGRHQKAMSPPATSVTGLRTCRRTIVACFVFRREISRRAVWDFFDSIDPEPTLTPIRRKTTSSMVLPRV
jgi:hypothetical protein